MSDFSRAGWFDNTMNQAVTEQIVKEARCAPRSVPLSEIRPERMRENARPRADPLGDAPSPRAPHASPLILRPRSLPFLPFRALQVS